MSEEAVLAGRTAIVTGANQGLGRAIARRFVEAGASVALVARGERLLEETRNQLLSCIRHAGQSVHALPGDVSRADAVDAVVNAARERLGDIAILVNNAGGYGPLGRIEDVKWDAWIQAFEVNLFGTALMCRAVIPGMRAQRYGKIINISGGGATAPLPRFSAYAAAKAAVVRLTETLAHELQADAVDVNAIAPGALNTRLLDEVLAAGPDRVGSEFYARSLRQRDEGGVPLDKGAALAVFLGSAASDGITGRLLSAVWDDWAQLPAWRDRLAKSDIYTLRRIVPEDRPEQRKAGG